MKRLIQSIIILGLSIFASVEIPMQAMQQPVITQEIQPNTVPDSQTQGKQGSFRLHDYLFDTGFEAALTGIFAAQEAGARGIKKGVPLFVAHKIAHNFVERTTVDLARTGINRVLGFERPHQQELVNWGVDCVNRGVKYRFALPKSQTRGWLKNYLFGIFLPSFAKNMVVDIAHTGFVRATGIDYPEWVKKRWLLYMFALEIPRFAKDFLGMGCELIYNVGDILDKKIKMNRRRK